MGWRLKTPCTIYLPIGQIITKCPRSATYYYMPETINAKNKEGGQSKQFMPSCLQFKIWEKAYNKQANNEQNYFNNNKGI